MENKSLIAILTKVSKPAAPMPCTAQPARKTAIFCPRAHQPTGKEDRDRDQHDELAAPNIGDLAPCWRRGHVAQNVGAADPLIAGWQLEVRRDGWEGGRDDGHLDGGDEDAGAERGHD